MRSCVEKIVPQGMKTSVLTIYGYEDKNLAGTLENSLYETSKIFNNTAQMLLLMDTLQNEREFPKESVVLRTFRSVEPVKIQGKKTWEGKPLATFHIGVYFRQNASWQGSLAWVETGKEMQFRSVLELLVLLDSALV